MRKVIKRGADDWSDLQGKTISFKWSDGWDDYQPHMVFSHTQWYAEDPRYPRYYIISEDGGGYSVWETENVEVWVHD